MARGFGRAQEAVSPVLGVILMVAIAVALAGLVVILTNNTTSEKPIAPNVGLVQDNQRQEIRVAAAEQGDWQDVVATVVSAADQDCMLTLNDGPPIASGSRVSATPLRIQSGDVLKVESEPAGTCFVALAHVPANQALGPTFTFVG